MLKSFVSIGVSHLWECQFIEVVGDSVGKIIIKNEMLIERIRKDETLIGRTLIDKILIDESLIDKMLMDTILKEKHTMGFHRSSLKQF